MPNLERRIDAHNKSILRERPQQPEKMWNCRSKPDCPLKGECLTTNVIYHFCHHCHHLSHVVMRIFGGFLGPFDCP